MMRKTIVGFAVAAVSVAALAASVHFKQQRNPTFVDGGLYLQSVGALAGLGGGDIVVSLTAQANATSTCTNQGGQQAPGQNPASVTVSGTQAIPEEEIKNGNVSFNVRTTAPDTIVPGAPGCPNSNWTQAITDLSFTSAVLTVEQPAGTTVLTASCSFNPATVNGGVPASRVTCSVQ